MVDPAAVVVNYEQILAKQFQQVLLQISPLVQEVLVAVGWVVE
jgi:hypothetical protein